MIYGALLEGWAAPCGKLPAVRDSPIEVAVILQNRCAPATPQVFGGHSRDVFTLWNSSLRSSLSFAKKKKKKEKKERKKNKKKGALTQIEDISEYFFSFLFFFLSHVLSRHKTVELQLIITVLQKIVLQKSHFTFPLMFEGNENNTTVPSAPITANYCTPPFPSLL